MNTNIMEMAERLARRMTRTDSIYGMDEQDILCYFRDKIAELAPRCTSTDAEGQRKFFGTVLKNARRDILKRSKANRRKLHMTDEEYANVRLLSTRQDWREKDEGRVKRTLARLSPESREVAEAYVNAEWRHMLVNEFFGNLAPRDHVTLEELAREFGLSRSTFIRNRWNPMAEEFKKIWSEAD